MKRHSIVLGCAILLASVSGACFAADNAMAGPATTVPEILQMQHALRTKLEARSGEYSRFDEASIRKMEAAQDVIFQMLSGVSSLDQLNARQRVDLSNQLDQVKATLLAQEDNRLVCTIERKTGTNLTSRVCQTVAQREANHQESMRRMSGRNAADSIGR
jgi:hypothetical protein